jgi:hypothetical protein
MLGQAQLLKVLVVLQEKMRDGEFLLKVLN